MISELQKNSTQAVKVTGLIFDTDSIMTSERSYEHPPIMSEATPAQCGALEPYCFNK